MKITNRELRNLVWVFDNCKKGIPMDPCLKCPFYERYCHYKRYLKTQLLNREPSIGPIAGAGY